MSRFRVILMYEANSWSKWRIHAVDSATGRVSPALSWHRVKADAEKQGEIIRAWLETVVSDERRNE